MHAPTTLPLLGLLLEPKKGQPKFFFDLDFGFVRDFRLGLDNYNISLVSFRPDHGKSVGKLKSSISGSVITMSKKVEIQGSFEVKVYPNGNTVYTFILKRDMNKHFAKIKITYDKGIYCYF